MADTVIPANSVVYKMCEKSTEILDLINSISNRLSGQEKPIPQEPNACGIIPGLEQLSQRLDRMKAYLEEIAPQL